MELANAFIARRKSTAAAEAMTIVGI